MNPLQAHYIVFEGVIGVGKTTLARMFQKETGARLVLEVFEENPFLTNFYADRARYAFQTQIFFLLSRYHQQRQLARLAPPLISDYMFEKDRLFAQVNLTGDELETYYSVQEALAENVRTPDMVVYLKASTDTLMNRITARDRPYERNMDPNYINSLRIAYENFFTAYDAAPVLAIDTDDIDFVQHEEDRRNVFRRIRAALGEGPLQRALPGMGTAETQVAAPTVQRGTALDKSAPRLSDYQQFHRRLDQDNQFPTDPYLNMLLLQEEVGELARAFVQRWLGQPDAATGAATSSVREQLADVLASVIKLANYVDIDLEEAYLEKMRAHSGRAWDGLKSDSEGDAS